MSAPSDMKIFVAFVDAGNFSAGARALGLTPSAVSKVVSRLEDRLGVRLVDRSTRRARLTEEGTLYYERLARILGDIEDTERAVTNYRNAPRGVLRVNSSVPFAHRCLMPLLPAFHEAQPDVELDLCVSDTVVDLFDENADVAIRVGPLPDSAMRARKLGSIGRHVVAAPSYLARRGTPASPDDLPDHCCLTFNMGGRLNEWPFLDRLPQPVSGGFACNNGETLHQLALAGLGLARLGRFMVADDLAAGRLALVLEDHNPGDVSPVHAVFLASDPVPLRVRAFVDFLAAHVEL